jgi:hypothetical protein
MDKDLKAKLDKLGLPDDLVKLNDVGELMIDKEHFQTLVDAGVLILVDDDDKPIKEEFSMLLVEVSRYEEAWVIYPTGGSYFKDEVCRLPGGSKVKKDAALKVLDKMNGK